jgi:hypothetical protein
MNTRAIWDPQSRELALSVTNNEFEKIEETTLSDDRFVNRNRSPSFGLDAFSVSLQIGVGEARSRHGKNEKFREWRVSMGILDDIRKENTSTSGKGKGSLIWRALPIRMLTAKHILCLLLQNQMAKEEKTSILIDGRVMGYSNIAGRPVYDSEQTFFQTFLKGR